MPSGFRWEAGGAGAARLRDMRVRLRRTKSCGSSAILGMRRVAGGCRASGCGIRCVLRRERVVNDSENGTGGHIQVRYICERGHRPAEHGTLEFDAFEARWVKPHHDRRVQRMAECFLESYMEKRKSQEVTRAAS